MALQYCWQRKWLCRKCPRAANTTTHMTVAALHITVILAPVSVYEKLSPLSQIAHDRQALI